MTRGPHFATIRFSAERQLHALQLAQKVER
jgi:hypothetical protein